MWRELWYWWMRQLPQKGTKQISSAPSVISCAQRKLVRTRIRVASAEMNLYLISSENFPCPTLPSGYTVARHGWRGLEKFGAVPVREEFVTSPRQEHMLLRMKWRFLIIEPLIYWNRCVSGSGMHGGWLYILAPLYRIEYPSFSNPW